MFSLYLVSSQLVSIGLTPLINLISEKCDKNTQQKNQQPVGRMQRIVTVKEDTKSNKTKKSNNKTKKI